MESKGPPISEPDPAARWLPSPVVTDGLPLISDTQVCAYETRFAEAIDAVGTETDVDPVAAAAIRRGIVDESETIILIIKPSLWFIPLSCLGSLVVITVLTVLLMGLPMFGSFFNWQGGDAITFGLIVIAIRMGWQTADWGARTYVMTDRRVIVMQGVFRRTLYQTALGNLQHIAVVQSIRERVMGLGTIAFATAGSDRYDTAWLFVRSPYTLHKFVMQAIDRYAHRGL